MYIAVLIVLSGVTFFYSLASSSLTNWDEAWYAEIAKQIMKSGDFLVMNFGGQVFTDHPPAGFWIISIFQSIFGVNEFGTRVGSALFGIFTVLGVYLIGKKLFSKTAGFCAGLALLSAPWFVLRARTGNLDIFLTAFFVWTIYLAFLANDDKKYLTHLAVSLGFLLLTKTMVPFTVFPALALIFLGNKKIKLKDLYRPVLILSALIAPWAISNYYAKPDFIQRYLKIGLPGVKTENNPVENISYVKEYLHSGIGKWFWPGILGAVGSVFAHRKNFLVIFTMAISLTLPFVFSEKGHIWHMIPIYPFLLLLLFGFGDFIGRKILRFRIFVSVAMLAFTLWIFIPQWRANWYNFIDINAYVSDEAILSTIAKGIDGELYIDGDFIPVATFYSDKKAKNAHGNLGDFFEKNQGFLLITKEDRIRAEVGEERYEIIAKDRDKVLVRELGSPR